MRRLAGLLLATLLPLLALSAFALGARPALAAAHAAPVEQTPEPTVLTMTVSANPNPCAPATGNTARVKRGDTLSICYTMRNNSAITLVSHIIADGGAGPAYASLPYTLAPTAQFTHVLTTVAESSAVRSDIWVASYITGTSPMEANDSITITVVNPAVAVQQTLSTSPSECTSNTTLTVQANSAVYRCITLTNTGDIPLDQHVLQVLNTPSGIAATYTLSPTLPKEGGVVALTYATASQANKTAFLFNPTATTTSAVSVVSSTGINGELKTQPATSSATVNVARVATTVAAALNNNEGCGPSSDTTLNITVNSPVYYCLRLTNTGDAPLTSHTVAMPGQVNVTVNALLAPGAMIEISPAMLAEQGLPPILGPAVVTTGSSTVFVVTSTAAGGFQYVFTANTVSVFAVTPTWTPIPTLTPFPSPTPWPTLTPFPSPTPWPTPTPTETLIPPTPTWTRSFELSNLQTPTPGVYNGVAGPASDADFQATALAQGDPNAFFTPDPFATPPFDSALPTPFIDPNAQEQVGAALPILDTETPVPPPTDTPTIEPSRTPLPTQTPSPTVTPTATQRPIVYAAPAPPTGFAGTFAGVLDSTMVAAGILFVTTGAVVFFGVLGAVLGLGFLRSSRRPYQLQEAEDDNADFMAASPKGSATGGAQPSQPPGGPGDRWPTSLP